MPLKNDIDQIRTDYTDWPEESKYLPGFTIYIYLLNNKENRKSPKEQYKTRLDANSFDLNLCQDKRNKQRDTKTRKQTEK